MSTALKITEYQTLDTSYSEWYNFIYKLENNQVFFKMLGTWNCYKSCITHNELKSLNSDMIRRIL